MTLENECSNGQELNLDLQPVGKHKTQGLQLESEGYRTFIGINSGISFSMLQNTGWWRMLVC